MKFSSSNGLLFAIGPLFLVGADFVATRFAGNSSKAGQLAGPTQQSLMSQVYGSKYFNPHLGKFSGSK